MTTDIIQFNPFKLAGMNLKDRVDSIEIKEFVDVEAAKDLLKDCTELEKRIEDVRTSITKPVNEAIKNINNMAKEVSLPVNEAKLNIKKKIVDFNEKQEELKRQENERIQRIIDSINKCERHDYLDQYIRSLPEIDTNNFIIRTAIQNQSSKIYEKERLDREEQKRAEEKAKFDEEKKKMSEEQAKIAEDQMKLAQEKREFEAEKKREAEQKALEEKNKIVEQIQNTETDKVKGMMSVTKREIIDENLVPKSLCSPDSKKINEIIKTGAKEIPGIRVWEEKTVR